MFCIKALTATSVELRLVEPPQVYFCDWADWQTWLDTLSAQFEIPSVYLGRDFCSALTNNNNNSNSNGHNLDSAAGMSPMSAQDLMLDSLSRLRGLRSIYMNAADTSVSARALARLIQGPAGQESNLHSSSLRVLKLHHVDLTGAAEDFQALYESLFKHATLQEFSLCSFDSEQPTSEVTESLLRVLASIPDLHTIKMELAVDSGNWVSGGASFEQQRYAENHNFVSYVPSGNFSPLALLPFCCGHGNNSRRPRLSQLHFAGFAFQRMHVQLIQKALLLDPWCAGATLKPDSSLDAPASSPVFLRSLSLSRSGLRDDDVALVARALPYSRLEALDLSRNAALTDDACMSLLAAASTCMPRGNLARAAAAVAAAHIPSDVNERQSRWTLKFVSLEGCKQVGTAGTAALLQLRDLHHPQTLVHCDFLMGYQLPLVATAAAATIAPPDMVSSPNSLSDGRSMRRGNLISNSPVEGDSNCNRRGVNVNDDSHSQQNRHPNKVPRSPVLQRGGVNASTQQAVVKTAPSTPTMQQQQRHRQAGYAKAA